MKEAPIRKYCFVNSKMYYKKKKEKKRKEVFKRVKCKKFPCLIDSFGKKFPTIRYILSESQ